MDKEEKLQRWTSRKTKELDKEAELSALAITVTVIKGQRHRRRKQGTLASRRQTWTKSPQSAGRRDSGYHGHHIKQTLTDTERLFDHRLCARPRSDSKWR